MEILTVPNNVLTQKCVLNGLDFRAIADEMAAKVGETKDYVTCVGLAANQVGFLACLFVMADQENKGKVIQCFNPEIVQTGREIIESEESCLSCPGAHKKIDRYKIITVKYQDSAERWHRRTLKNMQARIFQHEMDHLNGILIIDKPQK
jgi:peptide deformylase